MRIALLMAAVALAGCAGGPIGIKGNPAAREVSIGGIVYVVAPVGTQFAATHRDYVANNLAVAYADHLPRKAAFVAAIEQVTRCTVVDSVMDSAASVLHANVKC